MINTKKDERTNEKKEPKIFIWGILIGLVIMIIFGNPITGLIDYLIELFR